MLDAAHLPNDIAALKTMLIAAQAREVRKDDRIERLEKLVAAFKQAAFGRKSEKSDPEQFDLALEDLETAIHAEDEADSPSGKPQPKSRSTNRGSLPAHLPRIDEIIEPASLLVSKYADHLPLYRQAQIMSRQGFDLDRSTLADWSAGRHSNFAPSSTL